MSLYTWRDLVIVIWGIVSILLVLIRIALAAGTLFFGLKFMRIAHKFTNTTVKQYLDRGLEIAKKVEERTARLPGAPGAGTGVPEVVNTIQELREMEPPFRSRKRTWSPI
jgi:hypothetical protein